MNAHATEISRLASQRVAARGEVAVGVDGGRTRLRQLYQEGAAKLRMPRHDRFGLEAILINTAGGLTGGDRLEWRLDIGDGASLTATTQANEKAYRSAGGEAQAVTRVTLGRGARLAWLPQETILYDGSRLLRRLEVELGEGSQALMVEAVVLGRKAHGERLDDIRFRDDWRIRAGPSLIHAEAIRLGPELARQAGGAALLAGAGAFATVLLVGAEEDARLLSEARAICGPAGGASFWSVGGTGKLLARLVAEDGYALRARLMPLLRLLNQEAELPKCWSL